jgi:hypothetical protein
MPVFRSVPACFLFLFIIQLRSVAQLPGVIVADKIIAVVGDHPVMQSEVFNSIEDMKRQFQQTDEQTPCQLKSQMIVFKILVVAAEKDSIVISDAEIDDDIDARIKEFLKNNGDLGDKTAFQVKEEQRESWREQKMVSVLMNKISGSVRLTPKEVQAYYDKTSKDTLLFNSMAEKIYANQAPHHLNLRDDYTVFSQAALAEKQGRTLDKWVDQRIKETYIHIDPDTLLECPDMKKFVSVQR